MYLILSCVIKTVNVSVNQGGMLTFLYNFRLLIWSWKNKGRLNNKMHSCTEHLIFHMAHVSELWFGRFSKRNKMIECTYNFGKLILNGPAFIYLYIISCISTQLSQRRIPCWRSQMLSLYDDANYSSFVVIHVCRIFHPCIAYTIIHMFVIGWGRYQ